MNILFFFHQDTPSPSLCATVLTTSWTVSTKRSEWRQLGPAHASSPLPSIWSAAMLWVRQQCKLLQMCWASCWLLASPTQVTHKRRNGATQLFTAGMTLMMKDIWAINEHLPVLLQIQTSGTVCWHHLMSALTHTLPRLRTCRRCLWLWTMRCSRSENLRSAQSDASAAWTQPLSCLFCVRCSFR